MNVIEGLNRRGARMDIILYLIKSSVNSSYLRGGGFQIQISRTQKNTQTYNKCIKFTPSPKYVAPSRTQNTESIIHTIDVKNVETNNKKR